MITIINDVKLVCRIVLYGWLLDYHLSKRHKVDGYSIEKTKYHFKKAQHYYKKVWKKPFKARLE